jgi:hypothetical protein
MWSELIIQYSKLGQLRNVEILIVPETAAEAASDFYKKIAAAVAGNQ